MKFSNDRNLYDLTKWPLQVDLHKVNVVFCFSSLVIDGFRFRNPTIYSTSDEYDSILIS